MNVFQPLINLLVLMSALSIAAERLANAIKLANPLLRERKPAGADEKVREDRIGRRVLLVSVLLALAVKADLFQLLAHLDAPWSTLGWVAWGLGQSGEPAVRAAMHLLSVGAGCILTGVSLGFGSKFWHDVLDIVYHTRRRVEEPHGHPDPSL